MTNKIFLLLFLFILPVAFGGEVERKITAKELASELPEINSVECKFKQEKQLKNLQKPIVSSGNFKFIKDEGVCFETLSPVKSTVSYTNKEYKQINDIILAVSNKKYSKIDREFDFFYSSDNGHWKLRLEPKQGAKTEKYIEFILVEGSKQIEKTVIATKDGNKTTQWFLTE